AVAGADSVAKTGRRGGRGAARSSSVAEIRSTGVPLEGTSMRAGAQVYDPQPPCWSQQDVWCRPAHTGQTATVSLRRTASPQRAQGQPSSRSPATWYRGRVLLKGEVLIRCFRARSVSEGCISLAHASGSDVLSHRRPKMRNSAIRQVYS